MGEQFQKVHRKTRMVELIRRLTNEVGHPMDPLRSAIGVIWNQADMSKAEDIEIQVEQRNPIELRTFREWFAQFDAEGSKL